MSHLTKDSVEKVAEITKTTVSEVRRLLEDGWVWHWNTQGDWHWEAPSKKE